MSIIIFTRDIWGHHLEYIHHIYERAILDTDNHYIFVVPDDFHNVSSTLTWEHSPMIKWDFFDVSKVLLPPSSLLNKIKNSIALSKLLYSFVNKYNPDEVFVNEIISFLPFLPYVIKNKVRISGIIYKIFLYHKGINYYRGKMQFSILGNKDIFKSILVLNDEPGVCTLNKMFKTKKFKCLPDPYIPVKADCTDIRSSLGIGEEVTLFIHFGALSYNKSTLEILESIKLLSEKEANKYAFIFAGVVQKDIYERFYELYEELRGKYNVFLYDEFCKYELLASLCLSCDAILIPYRRTAQSSGIIGYASQFQKPVIATNNGLLKRIVEKYKLGILIKDNSPSSLIDAYHKVAKGDFEVPTTYYCEQHTISVFQDVIFSNLKS